METMRVYEDSILKENFKLWDINKMFLNNSLILWEDFDKKYKFNKKIKSNIIVELLEGKLLPHLIVLEDKNRNWKLIWGRNIFWTFLEYLWNLPKDLINKEENIFDWLDNVEYEWRSLKQEKYQNLTEIENLNYIKQKFY